MSVFGVPMQLPRFDVALVDMSSNDARSRMAACMSFATVSSDQTSRAVEAVLILLTDPVPEIRSQALLSLSALVLAGAFVDLQPVLNALEDIDDQVRQTALELLDVFSADPIPVAMAHLRDPHPGVRVAALRVIKESEASVSLEPIAALLTDEDALVRTEASMALAQHGDQRGTARLMELVQLRDIDGPEAAFLLGKLQCREAGNVLRGAASGFFSSGALRGMSAAALLRLDANETAPMLKLLQSRRSSTRMDGISALCLLPCEGMLQMLEELAVRQRSQDEASAAISAIREGQKPFPERAAQVLSRVAAKVSGALREEIEGNDIE